MIVVLVLEVAKGIYVAAAGGRRRAPLDLDELGMVAVDLKSRVGDAEALADQRFEIVEQLMGVGSRLGDDVGGERREAARDRPDMQVVHLLHPGVIRHRLADLVGVTSGRGFLHQDA